MEATAIKPWGHTIDFIASSDRAAGEVIVDEDLGGKVGVLVGAKAPKSGEAGAAETAGTFKVTKKSADDFTADGTAAYWDDTANEATVTAAGNTLMGASVGSAGVGTTELTVLLNA